MRPSPAAAEAALIVLVAIAARVVVQVAAGFYDTPEAWQYDTLARNLIAGKGFVIEHDGTTHRALIFPAYPLLLAAVYSVVGTSPIGVGILQAALGAALVALVYMFAARLGRLTAALAALAVATHPGLLIYSAKIHSLNLDAVLAVAAALVARAMLEYPDVRRAAIAGITTGIAGLERITFVPTIGLAIVTSGVLHRRWRATAGLIAIWLALSAALVGPWIVRNALVLGEPLLTTTQGEILWLGNSSLSTGTSHAADGRMMIEADAEMRSRVLGQPDVVQNEIFGAAALEHMLRDPALTVGWTLHKLWFFWWFGPHVGANYPEAWFAGYALYYVTMIVLAAVALVAARRAIGATSLLAIALTVIPISILQAITYVEGRHRWAVEPLILVLAAVGAIVTVNTLRRIAKRPRVPQT